MNRVNVIRRPTEDERYLDPDTAPELVGWFDADRAEKFEARTRWDGQNMVDVNTSRYSHQALYRTAGGRWVLHEWSQWQGVEPTNDFVTAEQAREWLLRNEEDAAVARYFGPVEEERGPGRPEIGPASSVRLGDDLTARLDTAARGRGLTRAAMLREIVAAAV